MSYNGSGVFNINTVGQPVVTGTTISSTTFNNLTADLATGLTTALTKDGQSTPTANIGMGTYKITNLGAGTVASDAARLDQVQGGAATFITVAGTDTLTGTVVPALSAYATGNQFSFLVANTNTGAVTINVDGIGSKAITRTGTTALVAGDMVAGQAVEIIYDGTRFQLVNGNSFTNLKVSGTLGVTGVATFTAQPIVSSLTASLPVFTDASKGLVSNTMTGTGSVAMSASPTFTGTVGAADVTTTGNTILGDASTDTLNVGNGGLVKDASGNVGIGTASPTGLLDVYKASQGGTNTFRAYGPAGQILWANAGTSASYLDSDIIIFRQSSASGNTERMRIDSSGNVGIGVTPNTWWAGKAIQMTGGSITSHPTVPYTYYSSNAYFNASSVLTYIANGYVTQYAHGGFDGAHLWYTSATGLAGNAVTLVERMKLAQNGIVTMSAYGAGAATFSAAGVISSVSDETWKIKDGLPSNPDAMLQKLEPGYWYYNEEKAPIFGADRQLGFYAQNVNYAIGVEAAPVPEEGKPWGYYDRSVLAITVMSLQKALATIESLTARLEVLEAK